MIVLPTYRGLLYNPGEMEILVGFMIDLQKSYMDWGPRECA